MLTSIKFLLVTYYYCSTCFTVNMFVIMVLRNIPVTDTLNYVVNSMNKICMPYHNNIKKYVINSCMVKAR